MEKLIYRQAYDKIIDAYFKDEIKPYIETFCFCGTLAGDRSWAVPKSLFVQQRHSYSYVQYGEMEFALLSKLGVISMYVNGDIGDENPCLCSVGDIDYEDRLFEGICAALEVLKQIHRERGENVDEVPAFTKRNLELVNNKEEVILNN